MPECRSFHYTLPALLLTRSPGATRCIFNQDMSALKPSCCHYMHLCRIVISTLHVAIRCTRTHRSSSCRMHLYFDAFGHVTFASDLTVTSCVLCWKSMHLSPRWLPRINLLLLTSVQPSCQKERTSFPLLLSSSPCNRWRFLTQEWSFL